jgi:hypothetical protein
MQTVKIHIHIAKESPTMSTVSIEIPVRSATSDINVAATEVGMVVAAIWSDHLAATISSHELLDEFVGSLRVDRLAYHSLPDGGDRCAPKVQRDYRYGVLSVLSPLTAAHQSDCPLGGLRRSIGYFTEAAAELAYVADHFENLMVKRRVDCPISAPGVAFEDRFSGSAGG